MNPAPIAPHDEVKRMRSLSQATNPLHGRVVWSPVKSLWFTGHALVALVGGCLTLCPGVVLLSFVFTVLTLCVGHTLGLHRLLVHRSFACPPWVEYVLVHLGTVVGMGGPFRILYLHDIRDWAQRQPACHPFFIDQGPWWRDFLWQMHGDLVLADPPLFEIEPAVRGNRFHRFLQRTWMLQQVPWAVLFYSIAGLGGVVWGISVRITVSLIGHWLIGYLAHNGGQRDWHLHGHAVQGYNLPHIGLITMGECWHNNHHAFPGSARLGLGRGQHDPGWWALYLLRACGLAWDVKLPADLPPRPELAPIKQAAKKRASAFYTF